MLLRRIFIMVLIVSGLPSLAAEARHYPLIENKGQWPISVLTSADLESGKIFIEKSAFTYHFYDLSAVRASHDEGKEFGPHDVRIRGHVYKVNFTGADGDARTIYHQRQPTNYNYFLGNDRTKWAGGCASFGEMTRQNFYPGIDLKVYSQDFFLKYDFVVKAGANTDDITLEYEGQKNISIENGRLKINTSVNEVWEQQPVAWQFIEGKKTMVAVSYSLRDNQVGFHFPKGYDNRYDLIIDPEIVFSSYSGSTSDNFGYTATYDEDGYLYSGSSAFGQGYPVTTGAYQVTHQGGNSTIEEGIDMALSKYDLTGTFMVWSTFLGGSGDDLPHSIITNSEGELLVYGSTGSVNFPTTGNAWDQTFGGGSLVSPTGTGANFPNGTDIVVAHFNASCTDLIGSTYLGGSGNDGVCTSTSLKRNYADEFRGEISLDGEENILIVSSTYSSDFPMQNALQPFSGGAQDGILVKMTPGCEDMLWSTYIGGSGDDSGFSVSNNSLGELYVCGGTTSSNLSLPAGGVQPTSNGGLAEGYILKYSNDGQQMVAGTFWGSTNYDQLYFIEIDSDDKVYVFGQTTASGSTMMINAGYGTADSGNLLTKFEGDLSVVIWSTVFGTGNAKPNLSPSAFLVDYCNRVYISGWGITTVANNPLNPGQNLHSMNNLQVTGDAFDNACSTGDFYMAVFDENMTTLEYATFFGGSSSSEHVDGGTSRFDRKGVIYQSVCAGCGGFDDFPIFPSNAWSAVNNSSCNNGVFKFDFQLPLTIADFEPSPTGCVGNLIQFTSSSTYALTYAWDFGDDQTAIVPNPTHVYSEPGTYTIELIVTNELTCNGADSVYREIEILAPVNMTLDPVAICTGENILLGPENANPSFDYSWSPSDFLNSAEVANPTYSDGTDMSYTLTVLHDGCTDTYLQSVDVVELDLQAPQDTTLCDDLPLLLTAQYTPADAEVIWSDDPSFDNVLNDNAADPDIEVTVAVPSIYYVQITQNGCSISEEVEVNLVSFQTVIEGDFAVCADDTVQLSVLDPNPGFLYSWIPEDLIITGQNTPVVEVSVPEETTFTVFSVTPDDCVASDSVTVSISPLGTIPLTASASPSVIAEGQSAQLSVQPTGYAYTWTPPTWLNNANSQSPIATPQETIEYMVTASDGECSSTALVRITVVDFICGQQGIFVPNVFTPNKDNRNEKLFVRANNITKIYFVIYDRWGEKVFETDQLAEGWDGRFENRDVDPDVYVYYLEATCIGGETYFEEGNITVVR